MKKYLATLVAIAAVVFFTGSLAMAQLSGTTTQNISVGASVDAYATITNFSGNIALGALTPGVTASDDATFNVESNVNINVACTPSGDLASGGNSITTSYDFAKGAIANGTPSTSTISQTYTEGNPSYIVTASATPGAAISATAAGTYSASITITVSAQ